MATLRASAFTVVLMWTLVCLSDKFVFTRYSRNFKTVYQWNTIDYTWPSMEERSAAINDDRYVPKNNAISGIKVWDDRAYLSVPRWLPGVPSTLNWVPSTVDASTSPLSTPLTPFPSWEMQEEGNCSAIQYVQGMEIDTNGRMWVLDVGRRNLLTPDPDNSCPPKLLVLDLSEGGKLMRLFVFPEEVASRDKSFLNDLVVDMRTIKGRSYAFAYITDSGSPGGIVVYHLERNDAWRFEDARSMNADPSAILASVGDKIAMLKFNADGIALTPILERTRMLFYSPLGSYHLYAVPASALQKPDGGSISRFVRNYGTRSSQSDGMMFDNLGDLYFGLLTEDAVAVWSRRKRITHKRGQLVTKVLLKDEKRVQWADSFGFDSKGHLWFTTNRLQNIQAMDVRVCEINYRLNRIRIRNRRSYMYH